MIRELADHDPDRIPRVLAWPIREGLIAYRERMREEAIRSYEHQQLAWSAMISQFVKKPPKPPRVPPILRMILTEDQ